MRNAHSPSSYSFGPRSTKASCFHDVTTFDQEEFLRTAAASASDARAAYTWPVSNICRIDRLGRSKIGAHANRSEHANRHQRARRLLEKPPCQRRGTQMVLTSRRFSDRVKPPSSYWGLVVRSVDLLSSAWTDRSNRILPLVGTCRHSAVFQVGLGGTRWFIILRRLDAKPSLWETLKLFYFSVLLNSYVWAHLRRPGAGWLSYRSNISAKPRSRLLCWIWVRAPPLASLVLLTAPFFCPRWRFPSPARAMSYPWRNCSIFVAAQSAVAIRLAAIPASNSLQGWADLSAIF